MSVNPIKNHNKKSRRNLLSKKNRKRQHITGENVFLSVLNIPREDQRAQWLWFMLTGLES